MKKVVLVGDSIRLGYQDKVRECLAGRAEVVVPEENGGTSERVLENLEEWGIAHNPDVLHINCGLHDLKKEFGADVCAVPLDKYAENLRTIISRAKTETNATVIWALTTPVNEAWHHENKPFDRFEADVVKYNEVATEIAAEFGVALDDLFSAVQSAGRDEILRSDGVHFTPEGYALLGERVADCIAQKLG